MTPITIPQKLAQKDDLVVIPRREYEEFLSVKKLLRTVKPTRAEKKAIARGRKETRSKHYSAWQ